VQVKNERSVSGVDSSYSVIVSEPMKELQQSSIRGADDQHRRMASVFSCDLTGLSAASTICLSPPVTHSSTAAGHWLNSSLPAQSRCRVYSEDGAPVGSTRLQRGRPNSVKSGLPSPLQRSLLVSTDISSPIVSAKAVAVIDTSPILSTYSVTSAICESNIHNASVSNDKNMSALLRGGSKVSLNAQTEAALDDSTHNQAFTESMLADNSLVTAASDSDTVDDSPDKEVASSREMSVAVKSQSSAEPLSGRDNYSDDAALIVRPTQSSTTSLDSAVSTENMNGNESQLESELNIPRSFSKQSIVSHDSGVGLADPQPFTCHSTDTDNKLSPDHVSQQGSRLIGVRKSVRQQSVRFSRNLQVSSDVRNLLSKAGLEAVIEADKPVCDAKLRCFCSNTVTSQCEQGLESRASPLCCASSLSSSHRQSKLVPFLPISTNLLRVSCEQYSASAKHCVTNSSAVTASPAVSAGPPRIKSALLTPSFKQCLNDADGNSQLRSRFRGKPVKRLQSSAHANHSPVNPLSPRHVTAAAHVTIPVPFDLDV